MTVTLIKARKMTICVSIAACRNPALDYVDITISAQRLEIGQPLASS